MRIKNGSIVKVRSYTQIAKTPTALAFEDRMRQYCGRKFVAHWNGKEAQWHLRHLKSGMIVGTTSKGSAACAWKWMPEWLEVWML